MQNIIAQSYSTYLNTVENFEKFHNEVINMPRPTFSEISQIIELLKSLAEYILLIDRAILSEPINAKILYESIFDNFKSGILPKDRDINFEKTYLEHQCSFNNVYEDGNRGGLGLGRRFRHYTELLSVFNILQADEKRKSIVDIESLKELSLTDKKYLYDLFRNKILDLNINSNSHIQNIKIKISEKADYQPARAIIKYLSEIGRSATDFEVSILLGRIDNVQNETDILKRAISIGKFLPRTYTEQEACLFGCMGWKYEDNHPFQYANSQQPYFKFKTFLILMNTFGLINYNSNNHYIELTEYSKGLLEEEIPFEVLDLEKLLYRIDNDSVDSNELQEIILRKRTKTITQAIQSDSLLVEKLNLRNLRNPIIKNNKRQRSRLIMEIAKIKANFMDEVTEKPTFQGKNGYNYVEAHHIIEFSTEDGPDITDNLICLGPQNHSLIHHGSNAVVADFFNTCKTRKVITFERFKNMCLKYNCLKKEHVKILKIKGLISQIDAEELIDLIE